MDRHNREPVTFKFNILKRNIKPINNFKLIVYVENDYNILIEDPMNDRIIKTTANELHNYLKINQEESFPFIKTNTGSFISLQNEFIIEIVKSENIIKTATLIFKDVINSYRDLVFHDNNFKIEKGIITAKLPIFPLWFKVKTDRKKRQNHFSRFDRFWMEVNNKLYQFPYGNTDYDGNLCRGGNSISKNTDPNSLFYEIITTAFNNDRGQLIQSNNNSRLLLNLEKIQTLIENNRAKELHSVDVLYYLSQVEYFSQIDPDKIFLLVPEHKVSWFYDNM